MSQKRKVRLFLKLFKITRTQKMKSIVLVHLQSKSNNQYYKITDSKSNFIKLS
jgi:hypothetical protein